MSRRQARLLITYQGAFTGYSGANYLYADISQMVSLSTNRERVIEDRAYDFGMRSKCKVILVFNNWDAPDVRRGFVKGLGRAGCEYRFLRQAKDGRLFVIGSGREVHFMSPRTPVN